jgi:protein-tyrosine phosphatase
MSEPFDLLFVCTGNICRSPTAELIAANRLPPSGFRVHSAGTYGLAGYPIEPNAARPLAALGIGCDDFRARRLGDDLIDQADLVLAATRDHRTAVVTRVPQALGKTFTMREFARLAAAVDDAALTETDPADRARLLVALAAEQRGRTASPKHADDIADPYGLGPDAYARAIREITEALDRPLLLMRGPRG